MPMVGSQVSDFELMNQDGELVRLSDYRGKKVVLFAFERSDAEDSQKQAEGFNNALAEIESRSGVVLGISPNSPAELKEWTEELGLNYNLVSDPRHEVLEEWDAWGNTNINGQWYTGTLRSYWVIDENGLVIDAQVRVGPEASVRLALKTLARYEQLPSSR